MTTNAAAFDAAAFLRDLRFTAADLARAKAATRESRDARQAIERAATEEGDGAEQALRRGTALWLLGRLRPAAAALAGAGDSPQARLVRGKAALEDSDPAGAAAALAPLAGSTVDGPELEVDLATALSLCGDAAGARQAAGRIGEANRADALYAEALALEADGRRLDAVEKFEAAVAANPNHARALFRLAKAHDVAGDDDAAIELYRRCSGIEPTYVNALLNLGLLLEDHERFVEAESLYRRVLATDPTHERARLYLKDVLSAQTMYFDEDSERKEDRRNQILRTPISEFELSVRSRNCLSKMEIKTLGDLITKTEAELLAYKNFGETSLQEIKDILAQKGLRLGMGRDGSELPVATREEAEAELEALFGKGGDDDDDDLDDEGEEGPKTDPRALPIEKLELSTRALRCVEALEIETVGDLADRTEAELSANKDCGITSLSEVKKKLAALGLSLRGSAPDAAAEEAADVELPPDDDDGD